MIYFDNAATTKIRPRLLDEYQDILDRFFANAASLHASGLESSRMLEKARTAIASLFQLHKEEVIFTSGATEANNLAIKGIAFAYAKRGKHLITSAVEHPSVINTFRQLQQDFGYELTILPVNEKGIVEPDTLQKAMRNDTILVSIMAVNNEIGAIMPIKQLVDIAHQNPRTFFHSDTTQAIGKIDLPYQDIDMFVISAHKLHGLKGSGILFKKKKITLQPLFCGGGQEFNLRSGTNDVPKEIITAKTLRLALEEQNDVYNHVTILKQHLVEGLKEIPELIINSHEECIPHIVNFSLIKKKASVVVEALSNAGIMVSTISACSSKKNEISPTLNAMGRPLNEASNPIRLSFEKSNTIIEINVFIKELRKILQVIK